MSNDIITTDLQGSSVNSALVYLYELYLDDTNIIYFHPGLDSDLNEVRFYSLANANAGNSAANTSLATTNEYIALPAALDGIETASEGAANRPTLTIANVTSIFKTQLGEAFTFEELIGKKIVCRRTFEKYLYGGTNQSTPFEFPTHTFIIDRVSQENNISIIFELAAPFDVEGVKIPNRVVVGKYCTWEYQGYSNTTVTRSGCDWSRTNTISFGGATYKAYFDIEDRPLIQQGLVTFSNYSSSTTYSINSFVTHNGAKWRSETSTNDTEPSSSNVNWQEVIEWSTWSISTSYTANSYVKYGNSIWKCVLANTGEEPSYSSYYWTRVDYCSKRLKGCKSRFQFIPLNQQSVPSATKLTSRSLPFGAYIGTSKFK